MPVDLTLIPDSARRKPPPSLKRWLVALLIFFLCGGFLTSWLWPAGLVAHGVLFWHCFLTAPLVTWVLLLSVRWLCWLAAEWPAEGWDEERARDIEQEIQRGQRFLIVDEVCVHLPHAVTSRTLTHQFILPQGVVLPAVVDENTKIVSYQASFHDIGQPLADRVNRRLNALLDDSAIQAALSQRDAARSLMVVIQTDSENQLREDEIAAMQKRISPKLPISATVHFLPQFGLTDIDNWLDVPDVTDALLILSVQVKAQVADGEGEAAVALLLRSTQGEHCEGRSVAHIHRPEHSRDATALHEAVMQALQWGQTCSEEIAALWLAGMGTENKAQALLAHHNLSFPRAAANAQLIDIDMKSGHTGCVSPWLAIALAAGNVATAPCPQLIMNMPATESLPWCCVVYPPSAY